MYIRGYNIEDTVYKTIYSKIEMIFTDIGLDKFYLLKVADYLTVLLKENEELNLISRKMEIDTIISDHIYDCLFPYNFFQNYKSITDLGSGGGLPGIILTIIFPDKKIYLVEKSPKKVIFLNKVKKVLELENMTVNENLAENLKINSDVITARAFKPIVEILEKTKKYFLEKGEYLLYKGKTETIESELSEARKKFKFKSEVIKLEAFPDKERNLVRISAG